MRRNAFIVIFTVKIGEFADKIADFCLACPALIHPEIYFTEHLRDVAAFLPLGVSGMAWIVLI